MGIKRQPSNMPAAALPAASAAPVESLRDLLTQQPDVLASFLDDDPAVALGWFDDRGETLYANRAMQSLAALRDRSQPSLRRLVQPSFDLLQAAAPQEAPLFSGRIVLESGGGEQAALRGQILRRDGHFLVIGTREPSTSEIGTKLEQAAQEKRRVERTLRQTHQRYQAVPERIAGQTAAMTAIMQQLRGRRAAGKIPEETRDQLEAILQTAPDAVFVVDRQGRILYANDAGVQVVDQASARPFGLDLDQAVANLQVSDAAGNPVTVDQMPGRVALAGKRTDSVELSYRDRDSGETHWLVAQSVPIFDSQGNVLCSVTTGHDITAQKQVEIALRESEIKHRLLLNSILSPVVALDREMTILYCNEAYAQFLGSTVQDLEGANLLEFYPPFVNQPTYHAYQTVLETGQPQQIEGRFYEHYLNASVYPTPWGILAIAEDVTERKQAEVALNKLLEKLSISRNVDAELTRYLDAEYVLTMALDTAMRVSGADAGFIGIVEGDRINLRQAIGYSGQTFSGPYLPPDLGGVQRILREQRGELIHDVRQDGDYVPLIAETHAKIIIPLVSYKELIGVINLETSHARGFSDETYEFLEALTAHMAIAIQNALLFEREQDERVLAEALTDIVDALNSTLDFDEVLGRILDNLRLVVPHDLASIMLIRGSEAITVGISSQGHPHYDEAQMISLPLNEVPALREALNAGQPIVTSDVQRHPEILGRWLDHPALRWIRSSIVAPFLVDGQVFGMVNLVSAAPDFFTPQHARRLQALANHASIAIRNAQLHKQAQELAALQERQRLARDLHDAVSQTLFSASITAEMLLRLWDRSPQQVEPILAQLVQLTRGAQAEMRTLLLELRPADLLNTPLEDMLHHLTVAASARCGIPVALAIDGVCALAPDVKTMFYRVAQEALSNMEKYAEAQEVSVELCCTPGAVELVVSDDGRGFAPEHIPSGHLGLKIMQERAAAVGAVLQVISAAGQGTTIRAAWNDHGGDEQCRNNKL